MQSNLLRDRDCVRLTLKSSGKANTTGGGKTPGTGGFFSRIAILVVEDAQVVRRVM